MTKETLFITVLCGLLYSNTQSVVNLFYNKFEQTNTFTLVIPLLAFHTVAFIVSFIHWFLDTWTTNNDTVRKRLFNQAKTHHYYPGLVVKKGVFARNDDAIYGSIMFGIVFVLLNRYFAFSLNSMLYIHCLGLSSLVSLEIHRYAHMPIVEVPEWIRGLQRTGIILSKESHYQHHNGQFNGSYDLMSGWMNNIVNASGLYPILERLVTRFVGLEPRTYLTDQTQKKELTTYYKGHND